MVQTLQNFINGEFVTPAGTGLLPIVNPANGDVVAQAPISVQADVDAAMTAAENAFETWRTPRPASGSACCSSSPTRSRPGDELVDAECRNTGKPLA